MKGQEEPLTPESLSSGVCRQRTLPQAGYRAEHRGPFFGGWVTLGHSLNLSVSGSYRAEGLEGPPSSEVLGSISWQVEPGSLRGVTCACPHPGPCSLLGPHVTCDQVRMPPLGTAGDLDELTERREPLLPRIPWEPSTVPGPPPALHKHTHTIHSTSLTTTL